MKRLHGCSRNAFTLVELMVVMAIITILTATIFPVFAQVRNQSKQTVCISNGRQIGTGVLMYASDYDDRLPIMTYKAGSVSQTQFNLYYCQVGHSCAYCWADEMMPYVKNLSVFACPADTSNFSWSSKTLAKLSYGINAYAYWFHGGRLSSSLNGQGPALEEIPSPAERVFVGETSSRLETVALWCFRSPQLNHDPEHNSCWDKHGRYMAMFFDGHSKIVRLHGLPYTPYTTAPSDCPQNPTCLVKYYPDWAPWLP